ncbi:MAG: LytTR family DNA-binding domain-containing protein [Acidobacteriota bacterium]|nr:LytTR family DNA-binding domain-containing protein [Acidobacteriota bacterium]
MDQISALVVDDERLSRQRIRRLLSVEPDINVIGECANGDEAVRFLNERTPDLLFIDIQMPGQDGFSVLANMSKERVPIIIFVTAFDEHALKAFEVQAFDYLLKPFDRRRLQVTVQRARDQLRRLRGDNTQDRLMALLEGLGTRRSGSDRLAIKTAGHVVFVKTEDVSWIEAADNYVCLHCGPETHILRETMNALEARLDSSKFLRVHRSTIVNVDRIKELQPWFRGDYLLVLQDGTQLTLSRTYREKLQHTLLKTI